MFYKTGDLFCKLKPGFSCNDVALGSEELSELSKFLSPNYGISDIVCLIKIGVQTHWKYEFPEAENIEKNKLKKNMDRCDSSNLKEIQFVPKPGFTCDDWPDSEELSWYRKSVAQLFEKICSIHVPTSCEELYTWPRKFTVEKVRNATLECKSENVKLPKKYQQ